MQLQLHRANFNPRHIFIVYFAESLSHKDATNFVKTCAISYFIVTVLRVPWNRKTIYSNVIEAIITDFSDGIV